MTDEEWREFLAWAFYSFKLSDNKGKHLRMLHVLLSKHNLSITHVLNYTSIAQNYIIDSFRIGIVK